jgi:hypothetical protein
MDDWDGMSVYEYRKDISYADIGETNISCGVYDITGVNELTEKNFINLVNKGDGYNTLKKGITYIFSDNSGGNGRHVARYVKKYKLGSIAGSSWRRNPNSGKMIKLWHWHYNGKKISAKASKNVR